MGLHANGMGGYHQSACPEADVVVGPTTGRPWGPTEGACSMAVPIISTRPRTNVLRMPSTHPAFGNDNHR